MDDNNEENRNKEFDTVDVSRLMLYMKLEKLIRKKYQAKVVGSVAGGHTEVQISNVGRNTPKTTQIRVCGIDEVYHETYIRAAERFIERMVH